MSINSDFVFGILGKPKNDNHLSQETLAKELWTRLLASKGTTPGEMISTLWTNDLVAVTQKDVYGGGTIVVGPDMGALFFGSALQDAKAAAAYLKGRRTPMTNFEGRSGTSSRR